MGRVLVGRVLVVAQKALFLRKKQPKLSSLLKVQPIR